MRITKQGYKEEIEDYFFHIEAGLVNVGTDEDGEIEWVGKDHNWTAYNQLVDGVDPEDVHSYLVTQG